MSAMHWNDVLTRLKDNKLIELRLGCQETAQLSPNVRVFSSLSKALKANTSLRRIRIGWHWQRHQRDGLYNLLGVLAKSIRAHQLQSIKITLNDWIPAAVLDTFLQHQTALSTLDLQAVNIRHVHKRKGGTSDYREASQRTDATDSVRSTDSFSTRAKRRPTKSRRGKHRITDSFASSSTSDGASARTSTVVPILLDGFFQNHQYQTLSELKLVDCGLTDDSVLELCKHILPTTRLSVRGNRKITWKSACALVEKAQSCLDLSLCDLDSFDLVQISRAVGQREEIMEELFFCGNYRMGLPGVRALFDVCPFKVEHVDISYSDLSEAMTLLVLQKLSDLGEADIYLQRAKPTVLKRLVMHGCMPSSDDGLRLLLSLLQHSSLPLRALAINDPKNERKYISADRMLEIALAMKDNYEMEELEFDFHRNQQQQRAWKQIEYWQQMNRAGRRLLRPSLGSEASAKMKKASHPLLHRHKPNDKDEVAVAYRKDKDDWIGLLIGVQEVDEFDSLYWVVRNSAERINCT